MIRRLCIIGGWLLFETLLETKVLNERWRVEYNTIRPHNFLGYRPPSPAMPD